MVIREYGLSSWFGAALAVDPQVPTTVYLGALNGGGIFKSTDSGLTWANLRHDSAHAIAVDPFASNHVLAAAFDEGVIETHNGGSTWQPVTNLPPPPQGSATITGITFHPTQAGTIYLSAQGGGVGVIRSTNGGASYAIANTGLTTDHATSAVAVNPQTPTMLFLGTDQGVFQSTDGGNSWALKTSRLTSTISIDGRVTPPVIYISGAKSTDLGATWTAIPNTGPIIVDPSTPNSIFTVSFNVSGPQSAAWSPDGGTTLFPLNVALGQPGLFLGFGGNGIAIAPSSPQVLFVASSTNGILRFPVGP